MSIKYNLQTTLEIPYEAAIDKVTAALQKEGFGILTEIDVQATLKKKLDAEFRRYVILGACNPNLAHQALQAELEIGLLLPCNVIVYETEAGQSVVSLLHPLTMVEVVDNPALKPVAEEAQTRLERVQQALEGSN